MYDGDRLVGAVVTREPEFTPAICDLLLAHVALEADKNQYGIPMSEATSPMADPSKPGGYRYEAVPKPLVDRSAQAVGLAQDAYYKQWPDAPRHGHLWHVKRVDN